MYRTLLGTTYLVAMYVVFLVCGGLVAHAEAVQSPTTEPSVIWSAEGFATTSLTVTTSATPEEGELNATKEITLQSTTPFDGSLTASHAGTIELFLTGEGEMTFTLSGLEADTEYHRYLNHYGNHTAFTTDEYGEHTFMVDVSGMAFVYIQDTPSTIFLTNDATGGDCTEIGTWDAGTKTCTLTTYATQTIQIGNDTEGSADGITLDGNGYTISGSNSSPGVYVYNADNITLRNLDVQDFAVGIYVIESADVSVSGVDTATYRAALSATYSERVSIRDSRLTATNFGVTFWGAREVTIDQTSVHTNRVTLLTVRDTDTFTLTNLTLESDNGSGVFLMDSRDGNIDNVDVTVRRTDSPFYIHGDTDEHFNHTITNFTGNELPVLYYRNKDGETLNGGGADTFNVYCAFCTDTTIEQYRFPEYTAGGVRLWNGERVVIQDNEFDRPTMPIRILNSSGTIVRDNSISSSASLMVPYILFSNVDHDKTLFYQNTLRSYSPPVHVSVKDDSLRAYRELPVGGNHWTSYDEPSEGCEDSNEDFVCDTPYTVPNTYDTAVVVDEYPWVSPNAWEDISPEVDTLTLPTEGRYAGERGVDSGGPNPERGYPDDDVFTFKVVYTNAGNTAPESVEVDIGGTRKGMAPDTSAVDEVLKDGDYTNGEQYVATTTLSKGGTWYAFHAMVAGEDIVLAEDTEGGSLSCMAGYSSIAFVPGIQSSRLFLKDGLTENKLWEPNRDGDARKLALNEDGSPSNDGIYTKTGPDGVIDEALGVTTNIYKSFLDDLDDWKNEEHIIADYAVLPYDWRYSYDTILGSGVVDDDDKLWYGSKYATNTPYMYERLQSLSDQSASGRIFLVGHSMGGLVIKKMLADMEDDESHPYRELLGKVDNVALVASPQLGTPKAVASLLHGSEQELDIPVVHYPNFITDETARLLGNGLPSAYTLLPSRMYFDRVKDVNLEGEEGSYTELIINGDCSTAKDYEGMLVCFDTADLDAGTDLVTPLKPRSEYVEYADGLHNRLDSWTPPDMDDDGKPDFTVTQIAGWGVSTISAIEYKEKERETECPPDLTGTCTETFMDPQPRYTMDGDRTVVVPSAVSMNSESENSVNKVFIDMQKYNEDKFLFISKHIDRTHANILEISPLRTILKNITENKDATEGNPEYVYTDYSELEYTEPYMRLAMHSPVDVEVFENEDRIGKKVLPDGGIWHDAEVTNSYYDEFVEGKYIGFPLGGKMYDVHLSGTAKGTFTFEITVEENGVVTDKRTFTDVPVTANTQAELSFTKITDIETLPLDTDGDGTVDTTVYPDETQKEVTYDDLIDALQELTVPYKYSLIRRAQIAQRFDDRGRERIAKLLLRSVERSVTRLSSHRLPRRWRIPEESKNEILEIISELKGRYENT